MFSIQNQYLQYYLLIFYDVIQVAERVKLEWNQFPLSLLFVNFSERISVETSECKISYFEINMSEHKMMQNGLLDSRIILLLINLSTELQSLHDF